MGHGEAIWAEAAGRNKSRCCRARDLIVYPLAAIGALAVVVVAALVIASMLQQLVQITRAGDASVSEQLDEMQRWLDKEGIRAIDLHAVRILTGRVIFEATFPNPEDADRFIRAFGDLGWRKQ